MSAARDATGRRKEWAVSHTRGTSLSPVMRVTSRHVRLDPGNGLLRKKLGKRICCVKLLAQSHRYAGGACKLGVALDIVMPQGLFVPEHIPLLSRAAKALTAGQVPFTVAVNRQRDVRSNRLADGAQAS